MKIIGVDPALKNTGFAAVEAFDNTVNFPDIISFTGKYLKILETGVIKSSAKDSLEYRVLKIFNEISVLIEKYSPDKLVIEKLYSHYNHPTTAILMGHARGVILLAAEIAKVKVISLSATKVKKSVTGRGNASKLQINRMVKHIFKKNNISDSYDITDSLALVLASINLNSKNLQNKIKNKL